MQDQLTGNTGSLQQQNSNLQQSQTNLQHNTANLGADNSSSLLSENAGERHLKVQTQGVATNQAQQPYMPNHGVTAWFWLLLFVPFIILAVIISAWPTASKQSARTEAAEPTPEPVVEPEAPAQPKPKPKPKKKQTRRQRKAKR